MNKYPVYVYPTTTKSFINWLQILKRHKVFTITPYNS